MDLAQKKIINVDVINMMKDIIKNKFGFIKNKKVIYPIERDILNILKANLSSVNQKKFDLQINNIYKIGRRNFMNIENQESFEVYFHQKDDLSKFDILNNDFKILSLKITYSNNEFVLADIYLINQLIGMIIFNNDFCYLEKNHNRPYLIEIVENYSI
jgi:hypothetical protein